MKEHTTDDSGHLFLQTGEPNRDCLVELLLAPEGYRFVTKQEKVTYKVPSCAMEPTYNSWEHVYSDDIGTPFTFDSTYAIPVTHEWEEDKRPLECEINGYKLTAHNKQELIDRINESIL